MFVGFLIAVVAASGTYFFYPPVKSVQAQSDCATYTDLIGAKQDIQRQIVLMWKDQNELLYNQKKLMTHQKNIMTLLTPVADLLIAYDNYFDGASKLSNKLDCRTKTSLF